MGQDASATFNAAGYSGELETGIPLRNVSEITSDFAFIR
jgi:hypothetical protein